MVIIILVKSQYMMVIFFFLAVSQGSSRTNHIDRSNVHVVFGLSFLEATKIQTLGSILMTLSNPNPF